MMFFYYFFLFFLFIPFSVNWLLFASFFNPFLYLY